MDQRRVVAFLAISFLILMVFSPKPEEPKKDDNKLPPPAGEQVQEEQAEVEAGEVATAEATEEGEATEIEEADAAANEPVADQDLEYVTLGSVDENSAYRVLVTLTNQGAGVRRVELSSSRFRDLHDRNGYLGHLELVADAESGLLVQAVGAGTPAEAAGLKVGDRLLSATPEGGEAKQLTKPEELTELLKSSKPKKGLSLKVARDQQQVDLSVTLGRRPLEVIRPEKENVLLREKKLPAGSVSPPSFQMTMQRIGALEIGEDADEIDGLQLRDANWEIVDRSETSVTFRYQLPQQNLEVLKRYVVEPVPAEKQADDNYPGYGLKLDIEIRNLSEETQQLAYQLDGPNGLPMEGWWYASKIGRNWGAAGIRDIIADHDGGDTVQIEPIVVAKEEADLIEGQPLSYIGVDAQYFSVMMIPIRSAPDEAWVELGEAISLSPKPHAKEMSYQGRYTNATFQLNSHTFPIAAGESLQHSYDIFAGPKRPELLENYKTYGASGKSLRDLVTYGWFGTVAKIMLSVLHFFYGITSNYGIAIILLTVLVRSLMFPISRKQAQSMAKMQLLKPEMDKIKEKYKNDMQKQSQATQELYRKHNINPIAGCLPMFIQLPIFLGLYRALMVDVELRQAPLLSDSIRWCSNLAAPDMLINWSSWMPAMITRGEGIFGLGPYLNVLPLITVSMFLLQQKLFMPEAANEQAAMQQKIMKYMMLFMGLMFFKVASGLCLYFIASSLWGIAERKLMPAPTPPPLSETPASSTSMERSKSNGQPKNKRAKKKKKR